MIKYNSPLKMHLNGCQRRDLASLMALYEKNYYRLQNLLPQLDNMPESSVSKVDKSLALHSRIIERHKFTTEIQLSYIFQQESKTVYEPNIQIRMYHDANVAEAISHSRRTPMHVMFCRRRHSQPTMLEKKWELNRFMNRWVGYCLRQGHIFLNLSHEQQPESNLLD